MVGRAALESPAATAGWAVRQGLASLPDMGLAITSLPAYSTALAGLLTEERAAAQGMEDPSATDRAIATLGGVVSAALGRGRREHGLSRRTGADRSKLLGGNLVGDLAVVERAKPLRRWG